MEYVLEGLEPQNVLRNFWDLSQIYSRRADNTQGISDYLAEFGRKLGLRVEQDLRPEKVGYKIRQAQLQKIPYMLIVGEKEEADGTVSVRSRKDGDKGAVALEEFIAAAKEEVRTRAL